VEQTAARIRSLAAAHRGVGQTMASNESAHSRSSAWLKWYQRSKLIGKTTRLVAVVAVLILAIDAGAEAQQTGRTPRIGYLTPVTGHNPVEEAFERSLQEFGWIKGRNIEIESRYSGGRQDTVAALAAELVGLRLDVMVAWGPTALAVKRVAGQIPVVFLSMFADAVDLGLVSNLARPGGNVTGVGVDGLEMDAKRLQLLKEAVPSLGRITLLVSSEQTFSSERRRILTAAVKKLGLEIHETQVATSSELEVAVRNEKTRGAQALYVAPSGFTFAFGKDISDLALVNQLPSIHAFRESVMAGGFLSYAPSVMDVARRGATYVDKILRGAKPGDLPVEQPTRFELVINLKTAKTLGLTVPPSLLLRADQVIE
jgi:putative ABC transport system substrate-binding protein